MPSWKPRVAAETPWIQSVGRLGKAYPPLLNIPWKVDEQFSVAKEKVRQVYAERFHRLPGRCALLEFLEDRVIERHFQSPRDLEDFLDKEVCDSPLGTPDESSSRKSFGRSCRLWILEDLEPAWMEVFGSRLGVDPAVLGEQGNTFNFLDSMTTQTRLIPSLTKPSTWFSLRYFEIRQTSNPENTIRSPISASKNQMTFAMNPRRTEVWRDIDSEIFIQRWRHAFTRRSASFWTNHDAAMPEQGWDAVILVDPAYDSVPWHDPTHPSNPPASTILQDPTDYPDLTKIWSTRNWQTQPVQATMDASLPYHGGSTTLTTSTLPLLSPQLPHLSPLLSPSRNLNSLFDELLLHWTHIANTPQSISSVRAHPVNAAGPVLQSLAVSWTNQLDLIQTTIAQSEYWDNDYHPDHPRRSPRSLPKPVRLSRQAWQSKLNSIATATDNIHYLRRQLHHFEAHMALNLERLGVCPDFPDLAAVVGKGDVPEAIRAARRDFLFLNARLAPMVERAAALSRTAHEQVVLQATIKGVGDTEFGVRLSLIASAVFPMTLVAAMFSMGGDFLPGQERFWVFWVTSVPVSVLLGVVLMYGSGIKGWVGMR